jgi:hypothetical protein
MRGLLIFAVMLVAAFLMIAFVADSLQSFRTHSTDTNYQPPADPPGP